MSFLTLYSSPVAPCKPENVTGDLNCSSNIMTVTWHRVSSLAQNFTVEATSASGVNSTCETNESNCSFLDLSCGQLYTFTITGHTNVCMSEMSYPTEMLTGTPSFKFLSQFPFLFFFLSFVQTCSSLVLQLHVPPARCPQQLTVPPEQLWSAGLRPRQPQLTASMQLPPTDTTPPAVRWERRANLTASSADRSTRLWWNRCILGAPVRLLLQCCSLQVSPKSHL